MFLREPSHILILVIVLVLLFGAKRLPDSARALGKSMKIFKNEVKELNAEKIDFYLDLIEMKILHCSKRQKLFQQENLWVLKYSG